jgi:putative cardiolipin synthase
MSLGRLHAKAAVIDENMVYIGSMNLDPRSESTNTELGIVARCPELAKDVTRVIDASRLHSSYELRFAPDGQSLQWLLMGAQPEVVLSSEPEVTPFMEFRKSCLRRSFPNNCFETEAQVQVSTSTTAWAKACGASCGRLCPMRR